MNDAIWSLYCEYLERTGDKAVAASLTLADMLSKNGPSAPTPTSPTATEATAWLEPGTSIPTELTECTESAKWSVESTTTLFGRVGAAICWYFDGELDTPLHDYPLAARLVRRLPESYEAISM